MGNPAERVRRLVAAILVMAATSAALLGLPAPATAASCSSSTGVSVVVDFTGIASGIKSACVPDGGSRPANEVITSAGFTLTDLNSPTGFICRVDGVPTYEQERCVNTPPSNAYWGLFWSDGKDGTWHYSDFGVTSLEVPEGGYIGLAWQGGTRREPGSAPAAHASATPTSAPTAAPTSSGSGPTPTSPSTSGGPASAGPKPTQSATPGQGDSGGSVPAAPSGSSGSSGPSTSSSAAPVVPTDPGSPAPGDSASSGATNPGDAGSSTAAPSPGDRESTAAVDPEESSPASATASAGTEQAADPTVPAAAETGSERVPTWLSLSILGVLLVSIAIAATAARRRTSHP